MKLKLEDIVSSLSYVGQTFWICDYRKENTSKKPIRHVKPTEIIVVDPDDFKEHNKVPRIYYSQVAFVKVTKNKEPKVSNIIPAYDNTGYRSYTGVGVNIFDNEQECTEYYNEQVKKVLEMYRIEKDEVIERLNSEIEEIKKLLK